MNLGHVVLTKRNVLDMFDVEDIEAIRRDLDELTVLKSNSQNLSEEKIKKIDRGMYVLVEVSRMYNIAERKVFVAKLEERLSELEHDRKCLIGEYMFRKVKAREGKDPSLTIKNVRKLYRPLISDMNRSIHQMKICIVKPKFVDMEKIQRALDHYNEFYGEKERAVFLCPICSGYHIEMNHERKD